MMRTLITLGPALLIVGCYSREPDAPDKKKTSLEAMQTELKAGGVYASKNGDGKFGITKILALDEFAVHARFYNEEFNDVPSEISTEDLTFVIGHAPMARDGFLKDGQRLVAMEDVSSDELEGYNRYLEAMREK